MIENKPTKEGNAFLAKVGKLQAAEKAVLRLLIKHNSALGVRTIRDYLVFEAAVEHKEELQKVLALPIEPNHKDLKKSLQYIIELAREPLDSNPERMYIMLALMSDTDVVASGGEPMTFHKKVSVLEAAMKKYLKLSFFTWGRIRSALDNLLELGFIEEVPGKLPGREKGKVYGVKPKIFQLWQQRLDYLRGGPLTESEKFWFG